MSAIDTISTISFVTRIVHVHSSDQVELNIVSDIFYLLTELHTA
jgi:hypothetical protein